MLILICIVLRTHAELFSCLKNRRGNGRKFRTATAWFRTAKRFYALTVSLLLLYEVNDTINSIDRTHRKFSSPFCPSRILRGTCIWIGMWRCQRPLSQSSIDCHVKIKRNHCFQADSWHILLWNLFFSQQVFKKFPDVWWYSSVLCEAGGMARSDQTGNQRWSKNIPHFVHENTPH